MQSMWSAVLTFMILQTVVPVYVTFQANIDRAENYKGNHDDETCSMKEAPDRNQMWWTTAMSELERLNIICIIVTLKAEGK
jgi:hypothetical protein